MSAKKFEFTSVTEQLSAVGQRIGRYRIVLFVIVVVAIYGYTIMRVNSLDNVQPSSNAISAQSNPVASTHIDESVVKQLQQLQNNSVSVQALFEQARNNPFQE